MVMSIENHRPVVNNHAVGAAFEQMLPELTSRAARMSKKYADRESAAAESLSFMYVNFVGAARRGRLLGPAALGWAAALFLKHRSTSGTSARSADTIGLDDAQGRWTVGDMLATDEFASPLHRTRIKLDWALIQRRLPPRLAHVLKALAVGHTKTEIAGQLGVSCCRLTQLLQRLAAEIQPYIKRD